MRRKTNDWAVAVVVIGVCALIVWLAVGCATTASASGGSVQVRKTETTKLPDGRIDIVETEQSATGPTYTGEGAREVKIEPVSISGDPAAVVSGGASYKGQKQPDRSLNQLKLAGAGIAAGGMLVGFVASWGFGLPILMVGAALFSLALYPWIGLVVLGIAGAYTVYRMRQKEDDSAALTAVVPSVQTMPDISARDTLTDKIKVQAGAALDQVKRAVSRKKKETRVG